MTGAIEIDGRIVHWDCAAGMVRFGGTFAFRLPSFDPSVDEIEAALRGWHHGYHEGKHAGRSILQNDFRNLMGIRGP